MVGPSSFRPSQGDVADQNQGRILGLSPGVVGRLASTVYDWRFRMKMTSTLTEKKDELLRLFATFDADGDGLVDENEFRKILHKLGGNSSDEVLSLEFAAIDTDSDGVVGRQEFMDWWLDYQ